MIDWSQAPEGATHKHGESGLWYKLDFDADTAAYWSNDRWEDSGTAASYNDGSLDDMTARSTPTLETMLTEWRNLTTRAHAAQAEADALFEHAGQCHGEICVRLAELGWGAPRVAAVVSEPVCRPPIPSLPDAWVIDGHIAPDDATHFAPGNDDSYAAWMKQEGDEWYCKLLDSNIWQFGGKPGADEQWISRPSAQQ